MKNNDDPANSSRIPRLPPSIVAIRHKYEDLKIQHRDLQAKYERVKETWAPPETVRELELIVESRGQRLLIHEQSVALRRAFSDVELRAHVPGNVRAGQLGIIPIHHLPNAKDSPVLTTNDSTAIPNPPSVLSAISAETPANSAAPSARHRPNRNKRRRDRRRREEARLQAARSTAEMYQIDDLPPPYQEFETPGLDPDICYAPRVMFSSPPESIHINLVDEENEPPQVVRELNLLDLGVDEIAILTGEVPNVGPRGEIAGPSSQRNEDYRGDPPPYRPPKRRCLPTDMDAEEN